MKTREQESTATEMENKLDGLNSKFGCQAKSINLKTDQENIFKLKSKKEKRFMKTRQSQRLLQ